MRLALIAAVAENGVIGINNKLPWYLPEDLKYFKQVTLGKPVIMGRATFESLGRPLPGRTNIVVSRNATLSLPEGVRRANSLDAAIELAEAQCIIDGQKEAVVIGGGQLYELALPLTQRLYLTEVHRSFDGDAWFPTWNRDDFVELAREHHHASAAGLDYSLVVYERQSA